MPYLCCSWALGHNSGRQRLPPRPPGLTSSSSALAPPSGAGHLMPLSSSLPRTSRRCFLRPRAGGRAAPDRTSRFTCLHDYPQAILSSLLSYVRPRLLKLNVKSWFHCSLHSALSPFPKEVNAEWLSCLRKRKHPEAPRITEKNSVNTAK